jgi:hypothetical protein|tara:strand:+ start:304 stop:435 length:132 start_codon:yes stop_codon:yes gene_type:complete
MGLKRNSKGELAEVTPLRSQNEASISKGQTRNLKLVNQNLVIF